MFEGILQPTHLLLILAIALLMFGPQKLPQIGKGLGEAIRGFREGIRSGGNQIEGGGSHSDPPPAQK
jgi:sec-independent protein translocase protein TatA